MSMRRRITVVACLVLALALAASAAGQDPAAEKAQVDARIDSLQEEIDAAKGKEGVLTSQLSEVVAELRAAEDAVDTAESSLSALEAELATERDRLEQLTARLVRQTIRLERLQRAHKRAVGILEARLRSIYISEVPDVLSFVVSASSFSEIVDSFEYMERIGLQDKKIAAQVKASKLQAAAQRAATAKTRRITVTTVAVIEARTAEAREVRDELAASRDTLSAARVLKRSALSDVRETRAEYLEEVEALAAQSASLAEAIREAQAQAASALGGSSGTGAQSAAGFIWPVSGTVVSGFGMRWGRMHEGIDITAPSGTSIWAAADGTVIHSGWLGGYGNLVVVDHGNGLATAYAHASAIFVGVGQTVSQGETIALVGSTGDSSGPHLHFEVRVNGQAVDPLFYL
jgi:murein DD-endopeptidase MepM/ murein hydrolase activator NlpD